MRKKEEEKKIKQKAARRIERIRQKIKKKIVERSLCLVYLFYTVYSPFSVGLHLQYCRNS